MKYPVFETEFAYMYDEGNIPSLEELHLQNRVTSQIRTTLVTRKKKIAWDFIGLFLMFVIIFVFYMILQPPVHYFRIDDVSLNYPLRGAEIHSVLVGLLSIVVPIVVITITNILFFGNKWDLHAGLYGTVIAYTLSLLFTSVLWYFVGGLRPNFLQQCNIDQTMVTDKTLYYTSDICRNKNLFTQDTFHGFPSGHASTSFAGFTFLTTYLIAHLKIFNNGNIFKVLLTILPIIAAVWMATSRLNDYHHSVWQLLVGILIGIISALLAYRLVYVQGFWFGTGRWSHIPFSKYTTI